MTKANTAGKAADQDELPEVAETPAHPAADADLRAGTNTDQNRVDFNDPTISGREAVERNLAAAKKAE